MAESGIGFRGIHFSIQSHYLPLTREAKEGRGSWRGFLNDPFFV